MAAGICNRTRGKHETISYGEELDCRRFKVIEYNPPLRRKIVEDKAMKSSNSSHRVLYAEDNEDCRELVSMLCRMSGIEVITAETSAEAWRLSQSESFDLYLLDSWFPDGDGLELCRRLRLFAPLAPILIYSGDAHETDRQKGLAAGASDYLTKPYMTDLAATIRQNIEQTNETDGQTKTIYPQISL